MSSPLHRSLTDRATVVAVGPPRTVGRVPGRTAGDAASRSIERSSRLPVVSHVVLWAARISWLGVAVTGGAAVGETLDGHRRAVEVAGTAAAWTGWAIGAIALAVPSVATLTLVRVTIPGSVVAAAAAIIDGAEPGQAIALLAPALLCITFVGSAEFGRAYIQASAYGAEARFGLRPPIGYLLACVATWLPTVAALVLVLPALAGRAWALGIASLAVSAAGLALLPRRWHQLSRRWLVLVPAGLVVHDPVVLADTLMMPRRTITGVGLDELGTATQTAADLTGPTPGLAVEIRFAQLATAVLAPSSAHGEGRTIHVAAIVVSPTRPGAVVRAVAAAGYPAG